MRSSLILAALSTAVPTFAAPGTPVRQGRPMASAAATPAQKCPDVQYFAKQRPNLRPQMRKLTELPPADTIYAMIRTRDGCLVLTPVRARR